MKNFLRLALCLSLVFVMSRLDMGRGTVYLKADGTATTNIHEAYEFQNIQEAYHFQIEHGEWDIVSK